MTAPRRALMLATAVVIAGAAAGAGYAAFRTLAQNSGNAITAGSVALGDNDSGSAMFTTLAAARPGTSETSCIEVRSTGTLPSSVRLFATVTDTLGPYLNLTVTRGTDPDPSFDACGTFVPDATNYTGAGPGVVYTGALSSFPTTYASGLVDPAVGGGSETWTQNETHVYRFQLSLADDTAAQGRSATIAFTWEAQSL